MMVDVFNLNKEKVSEFVVDERVFGGEVKGHLLHEVIRMQLANRRRGTSSTKNRALVRGGGRKPWRQKGTGRARVGSIRSPLWRGGGTVFGPVPRDYSYRVNKKVRKAALRSALSAKLREHSMFVVEDFKLPEIKTKGVIKVLNLFGLKSALIVDESNSNLEKSARNVPFIKVIRPEGLNVHDILKYESLVITKSCLEKITTTLSL